MAEPGARVGYLEAMRSFSRNARLYLVYSTLSGINNAIFLVAFVFYLEELFRAGGSVSLFGAALAIPVYIGSVLGVQALAHGANALPAGVLGDKFGRKRSFLAASLCAILAYALVLLTSNPIALLALAAIVGIGESFHGVVGGPFLMENSEPRERMHLFSLSASLEMVSSIVGAVIGGLLPGIFLGLGMARVDALRATLFVSLPFAVAELLPLAFMREAKAPAPLPLADILRMKHVVHRGTVARLFTVSLLLAFGVGLYFPLLNLHFEDAFHVHEAEFGPVIALNSLAIAVAILAAPAFVRRLGKLRTITYTRLAAVPFLIALAVVTSEDFLWLATTLFVLRGAFAVMATPVTGALTMELVDAPERATTAGFTHAAFDLFYGGGIFIAGGLLAAGGFWLGFVLAGLLYVAHAILWTMWFRGHPATAAPPVGAPAAGT
ncbi:MAG: MFS transporter [Euryarchaeota archaeon]|nr:MFS transporter [Euryarchaeota archaeon]